MKALYPAQHLEIGDVISYNGTEAKVKSRPTILEQMDEIPMTIELNGKKEKVYFEWGELVEIVQHAKLY